MSRNFIKHVLLREWDPIGVAEDTAVHDEYDLYLDRICALLEERKSVEQMTRYLLWVEVERMGLDGNNNRARLVAESLIQTRFLMKTL